MTDEQYEALWDSLWGYHGREPMKLSHLEFARAIESAATAPLLERIAELEALSERLKLEAQCHAQEARTANATIAEIYRLCSGGTGEPGNWHGAEPVRSKLAELEAKLAQREPAGWKLVPIEPTDNMMKAAHKLPDILDMGDEYRAMLSAAPAAPEQQEPRPTDMVLHCPSCGMQHVDAPSPTDGQNLRLWSNPPHRSHLCRPEDGGCGHIWRPADVHTNGVAAVNTTGKADSPAGQASNAQQAEPPPGWETVVVPEEVSTQETDMADVEHADISRRLALAIGYRPNDVEVVCGSRCAVRHGTGPANSGPHWYTFDYRDPRIIWPIAERFNAYPRASAVSNGVFWFARVRGPVCVPSLELSKGDAAAMAVALAVIYAKGM